MKPAERKSKILEGIQSLSLWKIRSNTGDKKLQTLPWQGKQTSIHCTAKETRIPLDHENSRDRGMFYPKALREH